MSQTKTGGVDLSTLNDNQRTIAQTLDRPLFVEAGAGSGKTFTLTQRVAWALSEGSAADGSAFLDGLDQVLVITFTEAAAREIKERVRSTLRRAGMMREALAVDDAWISTIHGMCRRILSRHALDLGLDPDLQVVQGSEQQALLRQAVDQTLGAARREGRFGPLFEAYDYGRLTPFVSSGLMGIVADLVTRGCTLPGGPEALEPLDCAPDGCAEAMRELAMRVSELGALRLTAAASSKVGPTAEALEAFLALPLARRTAEAAREALAACELPQARGAIKEAVLAAKSARALATCEVELAGRASCAGLLRELVVRASERYDELKGPSCLDNDDLVRRALLAVRDVEAVRRDYAGRFRLVMVDEFQDTDQLQLELISLLSGDGARHLCTVGDAQQSIYRFRGADVSVFRGRGAGVEESGRVRLAVNYRSHADVLALVDRVCDSRQGGCMDDFMHLDANPKREDAYRARDLPRIDVEAVLGMGRGAPSDLIAAYSADAVADALQRYREAGERPGDMALLLGATSKAGLYIDAIRARGMECVVTGGSTFTSASEVHVVCALLHTLANPSDTQSGLFPLLSSEVFGLDANDFCELGSRAQDKLDEPTKRTIDRGLQSWEFFGSPHLSLRLRRAHEVLSRALDDVRWRPVADVCLDVVRDSGWLARLEGQGAEGQARAANVLAAVRYVDDLTSSMGLGPARAASEFDRWLAASKIAPASLAGAEGGGEGTVRVMTVHASKGLEFPVCAVAEIWSDRGFAGQVALRREGQGARFALVPSGLPLDEIDPEELEPSADKSAVMPLAAQVRLIREQDEAAEAAERARLLYVALTRAREALVLSVSCKLGKDGAPRSALAAKVLGALGVPAQDAHLDVDFGGSAPASVNVCCLGADAAGDAGAPGEGGAAGEDDGAADGAAAGEGAGAACEGAACDGPDDGSGFELWDVQDRPRADVVSWRPREGVTSYSALRASLGDAAVELGAVPAPDDGAAAEGSVAPGAAAGADAPGAGHDPESIAAQGTPDARRGPAGPLPSVREREAEARGEAFTADEDRATNVGSAFHELAQAMAECGGPVDGDRRRAVCDRWALSARGRDRVGQALARWEGSDVRAQALAYPSVHAEVPFFVPLDGVAGAQWLEGAIDLLCRDRDGGALVVDYKTGDAGLSPEEVRASHASQAALYARVLLEQGLSHVDCAFVCVERDDPREPGQPLVVRYSFGG